MLNYINGDVKNAWSLVKKEGEVELWHDNKNGVYGVFLHEESGRWTMQAIVKIEEDANQFFKTVIDMVS